MSRRRALTQPDVMTIASFPPSEASKAASAAVPGTRLTPGVVSALDGPTPAGPEQAGALSLLHTTFASDEGAQRGYRNFAVMKDGFRTMPGFLRWLTFNDGPHGYALGLWRSPDDIATFVTGDAHQAMVREQRDRPFEYSQFAGVWTAQSLGRRMLYCAVCGAATAAPTAACASCGQSLLDPFAQ
jgi:heme-degrading monooxygenase HmoA